MFRMQATTATSGYRVTRKGYCQQICAAADRVRDGSLPQRLRNNIRQNKDPAGPATTVVRRSCCAADQANDLPKDYLPGISGQSIGHLNEYADRGVPGADRNRSTLQRGDRHPSSQYQLADTRSYEG